MELAKKLGIIISVMLLVIGLLGAFSLFSQNNAVGSAPAVVFLVIIPVFVVFGIITLIVTLLSKK